MLKDELANLINTESEIINHRNDNNESIFKGYFTNPDYSKLEKSNNYTIKDIENIFKTINTRIKYNKNVGKKFERTAKEIVTSGSYNGCSDYATVFESLSKSLNIPTIRVVTADINWIYTLQDNPNIKFYDGHHLSECYISNKWILVDPIRNKIYENYDKNNFIIKHNDKTSYYVYAKCDNLDELIPYMKELVPEQPNMVKYHNKLMKTLFTNFDLNKLLQEDIER